MIDAREKRRNVLVTRSIQRGDEKSIVVFFPSFVGLVRGVDRLNTAARDVTFITNKKEDLIDAA